MDETTEKTGDFAMIVRDGDHTFVYSPVTPEDLAEFVRLTIDSGQVILAIDNYGAL